MIGAELRNRFEEAARTARAKDTVSVGEGRGMVICAGGARLFTCAWVTIGLLRRTLGCTLPIQVWHLGPEELGPPMRDLLSRFDVEIVDAFEMARNHPATRLAGWELKPYALKHCRFQEVLLLDADNLPLVDPEFLFEDARYLKAGALFWPDVVRIRTDNPIWEATGVPPWRGPSLETGQLVVDKSRCGAAIELTNWMNQNADVFYDMIWGDKDTFLLSWLATDSPLAVTAWAPDQLEGILCQKRENGEVIFQHRTNAKWTLLGKAPVIEGAHFQVEAIALIAELAREWDGWIYNPPPRSSQPRALEAELVRQQVFVLTRTSLDQKTVRLGPGHRVTEGAAPDLVYWHVQDGDAGPELVLRSGGFVSARLNKDMDDVWRGQWLQPPFTPVQLAPLASPASPLSFDDPDLIVLVDDLRLSFEKSSASPDAMREFANTLAAIARIRPACRDWLGAVATDACQPARTREAVELALSLIGTPGRRHISKSTVQSIGLETTHGYERG